MDNTLLKMHVYNYNGTRWEGDNERKGKSKHVDVGNVVQVFGFRNNFPRELAMMEFPSFLGLQNEPKSPNPNI